jgi:hypothetical protein
MSPYPVAVVFAAAILFAGVPATVNEANRVHIANGREPNAGFAFAPDLIAIVGIWCFGTWLLEHFWGRATAWSGLLAVSTLILLLSIRKSIRSNRDYQAFLAERQREAETKLKTPKAQQDAGEATGDKAPS